MNLTVKGAAPLPLDGQGVSGHVPRMGSGG